MHDQYKDIVLKTWQERISKRLSIVAFWAACVYFASISLGFLDWMPGIVNSACLYGFLGLAALAVLANGSIRMGLHAWWYLIFTCAGILSYFYAADQTHTLNSLKECFQVLIISVLIFNLMINQKRIHAVMAALSLAPLILYFYLMATGQLNTDGERLGQTMAVNANVFASVYMIAAISSVYFVFFYEKKWVRFCFVLFLVMQIHTLALSGGRKYFLLPVILFCVMMVIRRDKRGRKQLLKNMLIAVGIIAAVVWAVFEVEVLYQTIGHRFEGFIKYLNGEGAEDYSSLARRLFKEQAIELWLEAPMLGSGLDSFRTVSGLDVHCHNNYLELLCDVGLIGTTIYYAFSVIVLVQLCKAKKMGDLRWFWFVVVLCVLGFDYGAISYNKILIHLMFVFATVMLKLSKKTEEKDAKGK